MYKGSSVHVVVPAFNEQEFIEGVIRSMPTLVDRIIVVDDCSTDQTFERARRVEDPRVSVIQTPRNMGVGGATVLGYRHSLESGDSQVIVKMDGDGQMQPRFLPALLDAVLDGGADYAKGNRFLEGDQIHRMPPARIFGNVVLTFLTKLASGYWNTFDPQNGFTAIRTSSLRSLALDKLHEGFFFENDMLVNLNLHNFRVIDVSMPAVYGAEHSDLSIPAILSTFPGLLLRRFWYRILNKYVLRDFSPIALFLGAGLLSLAFGVVLGVFLWVKYNTLGIPTPTGSIILCLLAIVVGFQLTLQAIVLDIQATPR